VRSGSWRTRPVLHPKFDRVCEPRVPFKSGSGAASIIASTFGVQ
jgi:hypothetical protein